MTSNRTSSRAGRCVVSFVAFTGLGLVAVGCSDDDSATERATTPTVAEADGAPVLGDPSATGSQLAEEFLMILQDQDMEALDAYLADGFQLQRADGTGATKAEYLENPAKVGEFQLGRKVTGVQDRGVLTVRWSVKVQEEIDGVATDAGEAPRLSTFVWQNGRWRMVAHANFVLPADAVAEQ
ncbi:MAG: nuclear transport factor 2 family protein [Actinomycetota bacterium]|nr:nuclear transport factor 2 family protein [Actinomycetota bacterium]